MNREIWVGWRARSVARSGTATSTGEMLNRLGPLPSRTKASLGARFGPDSDGLVHPAGAAQSFWGKPRLRPPWLGSSQRDVTTLPRVKKWTPSIPCACVSPKREAFQPPNE